MIEETEGSGEASTVDPPETLVPAKEIDDLVAKKTPEPPKEAPPKDPPKPPPLVPEVTVRGPGPWIWWTLFGALFAGSCYLVYRVWKAGQGEDHTRAD